MNLLITYHDSWGFAPYTNGGAYSAGVLRFHEPPPFSAICPPNIHYRSTLVTYLASKVIEFGEKRKIRAITPFKVIQGH